MVYILLLEKIRPNVIKLNVWRLPNLKITQMHSSDIFFCKAQGGSTRSVWTFAFNMDQLGKETLKIAWEFIMMVRLMAPDQDSILTL